MIIEESAAKKQGRIDLGRYIVVGVNKYLIKKDDGDDGDGNGDRNEGGEEAVDALRIDSAAVRESCIWRIEALRSNRGKNEVREALDCLERSATLSEGYGNNDNGINNINNGKNCDRDIGGKRTDEISTSWGNYPQNLQRMSVEAAAVRCTLGEILYALDNRWGNHIPSSPVVLGSYISSFRGSRRGNGNKGRGKKRDDNNDNKDNNHDEK